MGRFTKDTPPVILVDFDNTLTTSLDFRIPILDKRAVEAVRRMYEWGCVLVLWTCRSGKLLREAKKLLKEENILFMFKTFNRNVTPLPFKCSRKVYGDILIDDSSVHWVPGSWNLILERIREDPYFSE